ncbi:Transcriptional regulatory protein ros [Methylobacterium tardum]|uniref:Transcriptional regulator n=1 Tax=Methylobacterium tardum TaxID=374432 RepID=A0AA37TA49_9HYPH|nr:MucR family transcriptional regulator [Methylobacterium tardum]URD36275.1 MucR family transcriptional regulator [Methylobacterium tardum]GJE47713.1 Transcriptional regulatory protein ros [Methylobacterium tardum]GLS69650.1 transcriptional regulator [Methylobacterium tardum]
MDATVEGQPDYLTLSVDIVSAFVSNNPVPAPELPSLIAAVHATLYGLSQPAAAPAEELRPAVPVRRSVQPDFIVCLEDGKKFKSLKRHLRTHYDMTPDAYRQKWGLPPDYPMVAPNYAAARSSLAKSMGLGHQRRKG